MFDPHADQASGLRQLFAPSAMALLSIGCVRGDQADRGGVLAFAHALARIGRKPLLIDLLGGATPGVSGPGEELVPRIDAQRFLGQDFDGEDLAELARSLGRQGKGRGSACDMLLLAGDPLRLADLSCGLTDRMLLLAPADSASLARAYAQMKAIGLAHGLSRYTVAYRDARTQESALAAHGRLASTAARFLHARVEFGGVVAAPASDPRSWDRVAATVPGWAGPIAGRLAASLN